MRSFGIEIERYTSEGLFELWEITPDSQATEAPLFNQPSFNPHVRSAQSLALLKAYLEGKMIKKRMVVVADDPLHNMKPEIAVNFEKFHSLNLEQTPISMICTYSMKEVSREWKLFLDLVETRPHIIIQTYGTIISLLDRNPEYG